MENPTMTSTQLVADSYASYHRSVYLYIYYRINSKEEAEDLSQDVFLKYFIHTIARNLVNDYLRRHYKKQEITSYMYEHAVTYTNETESQIIAKDLLSLEKRKLQMLSDQRRKVYVLNRFQDKSVSEISMSLNISHRTVENHLFASRKEIREFIKQCI